MTELGEDRGAPPFRQKEAERMGHGGSVGGEQVRYRRMRVEDIDRVVAIANGLKEAPHWPREKYADAVDPRARPERVALVAEVPGAEIVAFAVAVLIPPLAELETIAVTPPAQRQGIARRLFSEWLAELNKSQITEVILEVRESNRAARALYRTLGFVESGLRKGYYADPPEDALLFRRPF